MKELYLPINFKKRLTNLTAAPKEVNGALIYLPLDGVDVVVASRILGGGTSDALTSADPRMLSLANKFFEQNHTYGFVEFHTHTEETVRRHGIHYAFNLSDGDIETITRNYAGSKTYRHFLVTPNVLKLHKMEGNNVVPISYMTPKTVDKDQGLEKRIKNKFDKLHAEMGIPIFDLRMN
ncbi:MAG TPA: hypothetical protein VJI68_00670 [Candidatus Nanoarchaeia archaeon]|nr:hypothetical protein [Candidatus Nanoarchaeia archaeon]